MIAGRGGQTRSHAVAWSLVLRSWSLVQEPSTEDGPSTRTDQAPRTRDEGLVRRRSGSRHRARENVDLRDIDRLSRHYTGKAYGNRERPRVTAHVELDRWHAWGELRDA